MKTHPATPPRSPVLLDRAMREASVLRDAVMAAASEAGRWRAEASRVDREQEDSEMERALANALAEVTALREGERVPSRGPHRASGGASPRRNRRRRRSPTAFLLMSRGRGTKMTARRGGEEEKAEGGGGEDARAATPPRAKRQPTPRKKWGSPSFSKRSREMDKENVTKFRNMNGVVVDVLTTTTT